MDSFKQFCEAKSEITEAKKKAIHSFIDPIIPKIKKGCEDVLETYQDILNKKLTEFAQTIPKEIRPETKKRGMFNFVYEFIANMMITSITEQLIEVLPQNMELAGRDIYYVGNVVARGIVNSLAEPIVNDFIYHFIRVKASINEDKFRKEEDFPPFYVLKRMPQGEIYFTGAVRDFANNYDIWWVVDHIGSFQHKLDEEQSAFQIWTVHKLDDGACEVYMQFDVDRQKLFTRKMNQKYPNMYKNSFEFIVTHYEDDQHNVVMMPEEY